VSSAEAPANGVARRAGGAGADAAGPAGATAAGERGGASDAAAWLDLAQAVDLGRPGLAVVRRAMGWMPVHMAAMAGQPALLRALVAGRGCAAGARAANSWTPMHCAAAHNQARFGPGRAGPCARGARFPARGAAMSAGRGRAQVDAIEALVALGCEAAVPDSTARTPLHVAAGEGCLDAIRALVRLVRPAPAPPSAPRLLGRLLLFPTLTLHRPG